MILSFLSKTTVTILSSTSTYILIMLDRLESDFHKHKKSLNTGHNSGKQSPLKTHSQLRPPSRLSPPTSACTTDRTRRPRRTRSARRRVPPRRRRRRRRGCAGWPRRWRGCWNRGRCQEGPWRNWLTRSLSWLFNNKCCRDYWFVFEWSKEENAFVLRKNALLWCNYGLSA